jgi:hypothetical protein
MWELYEHCISVIVENSSWRQKFSQAAVRSRFNYSEYNRKMLLNELVQFDKIFARRELFKTWTEGFEKNKGIFKYVQSLF